MSTQLSKPILTGYNTLCDAVSQSLSDVGCTRDIINSFNEFYEQNSLNFRNIQTDLSDCNSSTIIQYLKHKYCWNPSEICTFYGQIRTAIKINHEEAIQKPRLGTNCLSLSLAQSSSSDCTPTHSAPIFIDENSISASFPSILMTNYVSLHRKQKYAITAPCSPISESCNLNHYVSDDPFGHDSEFQVLDMISSNYSENKTNLEEIKEVNIEHDMKQIILNVIHRIQQSVHGNHPTNAQKQIESSVSEVNDIWSDEEQNGFVYIDEEMEALDGDDDVEYEMKGIILDIIHNMDTYTSTEQIVHAITQSAKEADIESEMKGIILNIVRNIEQPIDVENEMKGIILKIVHQIDPDPVYQVSSDHDIESEMRDIVCNIIDTIDHKEDKQMLDDNESESVLVMDRPRYVKDQQIAEKEETINLYQNEEMVSETVLIMDRPQKIKHDQIKKEEKMDDDDVDIKNLSLTDQFHSKSGTMVVIECPQDVINVIPSEKRYSIVVSDRYAGDCDVLPQIEEEDVDAQETEEEEELKNEYTKLSEKEKMLFGPNDHIKKLKITQEQGKRRSSFFVHIQSDKKLKSLKTLQLDHDTEEEEEVDPFAMYREYPNDPKESMQIQRISYLLAQYQKGLNGMNITNDALNKKQCVVRFICDGDIDRENDGKYKYNEELLLNDWYYILIHYCDDDALFEELYTYITLQIGGECNVLQCAFIKRNYKQFITNNDDPYYYGFTEHQQQTRIRFLDRIHCHLCHSYDLGFKLRKNQREYVDDDANDTQFIDRNEINIKDKGFMRLKRTLSDNIKILKRVIGPKRRCVNKFVTQIFNDDNNNIQRRRNNTLDIPDAAKKDHKHIKIPTKIEINDNYQFGQKFYYWKYHQNAGWKWYIHSRYNSIKQEMIRNNLLNINEWNMYYNEAQIMSSTFLSKSYIPSIDKYFGNYFYGIRDGDILRCDHILAVLLFTNDCNLQIKLNKSYRKRSEHESDVALKQRHSYYANWARLLCETVEIYTNNEFYNKVNDLYHGTNCSMYFNNIYASLYTPTSMTRSFEVATCYANKNGLLLHFENGDNQQQEFSSVNSNRCFECNWMSLWSNECEMLFVGGAAPLKFKSILEWTLSYNYSNYISAITVLRSMLNGDPITTESIAQPVIEAIGDLIHHQLNKDKNKKFIGSYQSIGRYSASVKIADFIYEYFNHFVQNTTYHIQFDLYKMNYDYYEIQNFFFNKNGDWIKFEILFKLFRNIRYLTIIPGWSADDCALKLSRQRIIELFHILKDENDCDLERISIDQPNESELSLKELMTDFKPMYQRIGWNIDCCGWKKYDDSDPQLIIVKHIK